MAVSDLTIPEARLDLPWSECGDRHDPDFGAVFARRVANGGVALSFDRAGRNHALTLFDVASLSDAALIFGRRFRVIRDSTLS
jgi:hypothetical protein